MHELLLPLAPVILCYALLLIIITKIKNMLKLSELKYGIKLWNSVLTRKMGVSAQKSLTV